MSTTSILVYQELQSNYESHFLSLKLNALPQLNNSSQMSNPSLHNNPSKPDNGATERYSYSNMFGWNGIEALSSTDREKAEAERDEPAYIHPQLKHSSSALSQKSLEMCTESLGCETGTCITESSIFYTSPMGGHKARPKPEARIKEVVRKAELPPPLTTSKSIHIQRISEHGRVVIKAVSAPPTHSYLEAERSDGRLKLSFTRDYSSAVANSSDDDDDEEEEEDEDNNGYDCETSTENNEYECCVRSEQSIVQSTDQMVKEEVQGNDECDKCFGEEMKVSDSIKIEVGVRMGFGKIQRPRRCKERGQRLINLEPFWVAT